MVFGDLLQHVGDSGRFQILMTSLAMLANLLLCSYDFTDNFIAAIPAHHCRISLLDNLTSQANLTMNLTAEALLRVSIPMGPDQKPEQCRQFRQTQWQLLDPDGPASNVTELETVPCLDGWTYDRSVFTSTIITEWDLVCDYQSFKYLEQTISLVGHLAGIIMNGILSDRFGRKPLLVSSCLVYGILGTCCAFVPNFSLYCILRFLLSASVITFLGNLSILVLEGISLKWYPMVVALTGLSISLSNTLLGSLAYVFRDWHTLHLAMAFPFLIMSLFIWWAPESVRWLMTTGRTKQAVKELQRIAFFNGKKDVAQSLTTEVLRSKMKEELNAANVRTSFIYVRIKEVIVNPTVRRTVICMCCLMFSAVFSLFGYMLDIASFGKDMFLTQFLLGVMDLPSKFLTYFIMRHVKRRPSIAFLQIVLGSSILVNVFVPQEHYMHFVIFLLSRAFFLALMVILTAFHNEITPTILRSTIQSIYIFVQRLASIFSALTFKSRDYFVHFPMILCGTLPIVTSVCLYFLPETFGLPLQDTIQEMEQRDKFKSKRIGEKQNKNLLETTDC